VPYKQLFSRLITTDAPLDLASAFALEDGRLYIELGGEVAHFDLGVHDLSITLAFSERAFASGENTAATERAEGAEGTIWRTTISVERASSAEQPDYWLNHADMDAAHFRRLKLNAHSSAPRCGVTPNGHLYVVDDEGIIRLYDAHKGDQVGAFQAAGTDSRVIALTANADGRLVAALNSRKEITLYDTQLRRLAFVRQVRDEAVWYDPEPGAIISLSADALYIIAAARAHLTLADADTPPTPIVYAITLLHFVTLPTGVTP